MTTYQYRLVDQDGAMLDAASTVAPLLETINNPCFPAGTIFFIEKLQEDGSWLRYEPEVLMTLDLVVSLLTDPEGISGQSYGLLKEQLETMGFGRAGLLLTQHVDATDDRFYLSDENVADFREEWASTFGTGG